MFGTLRFALAMMVAVGHLAQVQVIGNIAVFGFFALSGYLMTAVTHGPYAGALHRYAANRLLRIFPPYLAVLALTILVLALGSWPQINPALRLPETGVDWVRNLTMIGLERMSAEPRLVPPAWSVYIELWFYALIPLLARSRMTALAWLGVSVLYAVWAFDLPFQLRYAAVPAAALPFALGAVLWHCAPAPRRPVIGVVAGAAALAMVTVSATIAPIEAARSLHLYLGLAALLYLVAVLARLDAPTAFRRVDQALGNLAYPVFLVHWLVGTVMAGLLDAERSTALFWASLPAILALGWLVHYAVERPLDALRGRLRRPPLGRMVPA